MSKKFNYSGQSQKKMNFSELFDRYWYLLIIAAALIAAVIIGIMVYNHFQEGAYQKQLTLGEKYLEDGKYEESILAFDSAIRIKDKNPAAYRRKAAVYGTCGNNKALQRLVKTYPTYFISYSQNKSTKTSENQNNSPIYSFLFPVTPSRDADFEDSVVTMSANAKGQNKYSIDMDLVGADTKNGTIYYTTDDTKPTEKSKIYEKPINVEVKDVEHPVTVKAIAKNDKKEQTKVFDTTLEYSDIKAPAIDAKKDGKNEGKYTVSIKCDEKNAEVFYTTDGKDPTNKSEQYKKAFTIDIKEGETKTIKAVSVLKNKTSGVVSSTIAREVKKNDENGTKDKDQNADKKEEEKAFVAMPNIVISQDGANAGIYHVNILTIPESNKIYYTKDGKDPTVKSAVYKDAFTVKAQTGKTITIKAIAVDKNGNVSEIAKQEETPVVVNLPKETDQNKSTDKTTDNKDKQTTDNKGKQTTDQKDDSTKKEDTKNSDSKNSDTKSSDNSQTTKDSTTSTDSNKDTSLKDDSLPAISKDSQKSDTSNSNSGSTKSDSSKTTGGTSDTTSNSNSNSDTTADDTGTYNNSSSTNSNSGSDTTTPTTTPKTTAPSVSTAPAIKLTAPVLTKSSSQTGSGVIIEWKPITGAEGYEYHYENGTFIEEQQTSTASYEAIKNKNANSTTFTLKVRAYCTQNGKKTYSDWSSIYQGSFTK